jgi:hypothetical protein
MGNVAVAKQIQTLYVTIRRDELHDLKAERDQLARKVAQLSAMLPKPAITTRGKVAIAQLA